MISETRRHVPPRRSPTTQRGRSTRRVCQGPAEAHLRYFDSTKMNRILPPTPKGSRGAGDLQSSTPLNKGATKVRLLA
ncbi:hypothetical protein EVAR_53156_1 [Eumeta japonica]|uniref:Uncharacterized protein n=1 Tax=Eumeta variegata TaxID=151549 RepID=A0A4C1YUQ8_EUMVA|nr:hypothetical protein EVAR_53156_1 [Eumeta japonica]